MSGTQRLLVNQQGPFGQGKLTEKENCEYTYKDNNCSFHSTPFFSKLSVGWKKSNKIVIDVGLFFAILLEKER